MTVGSGHESGNNAVASLDALIRSGSDIAEIFKETMEWDRILAQRDAIHDEAVDFRREV